MNKKLTITKPDDWHLHLRDGDFLQTTVADTAKQFARAIIMPNLVPPIVNVDMAKSYAERIQKAIPANNDFQPLMTLYLRDQMKPQTITAAHTSNFIYACKLYPAGATTHAEYGVTDINNISKVLDEMQRLGMPLLVHGEVTHKEVDIFDREKVFIEDVLTPLTHNFPQLKIVFEHATTKEAIAFVETAGPNIAATITAHHLLLNRNAIFAGGINPHHYCLPILKRLEHQQALIRAATSGNPKFFLGTDSAPHALAKKECAHGCAGIYTAHAALECYAEAFEQEKALDKLEAFASFYGSDFYGLPRNTKTITLIKESWSVPNTIQFSDTKLVPFRAGERLSWKVQPIEPA